MTGHIRQRGKDSFQIKFDIGADPKTGERRIRYVSFRGTKREANLKLAELLTSVGKGSYVDGSKITVAEHVNARIALWEGSGEISAKTAERYQQLADNQINPFIGVKVLQKLRTIDIEAWHTDLKVRGRKDGKGGLHNRTIGHAHRVLSKALREAARHDLVVKNVAADESAPSVGDEEIIILTPEQLSALPIKLQGKPLYTRALMLVYTGMRRGELLALKWGRVSFEAKEINIQEALEQTKAHGIRAKRPKSKNSRRAIKMPDIVVTVLQEHRKRLLEWRMSLGVGKLTDDDLVFPQFDGSYQSPDALSAEWRDFADKAGMQGIPLHALRHTHASQLIDAGVDIVTVSKRLGHASPAITLRIYAHLFRKDDGKAAAAINAALATKAGA